MLKLLIWWDFGCDRAQLIIGGQHEHTDGMWTKTMHFNTHYKLFLLHSILLPMCPIGLQCTAHKYWVEHCNWLWLITIMSMYLLFGIQLVLCLIHYFTSELCSFALYSRAIINSFEKSNCQTIEKLLVAVFTTLTHTHIQYGLLFFN